MLAHLMGYTYLHFPIAGKTLKTGEKGRMLVLLHSIP